MFFQIRENREWNYTQMGLCKPFVATRGRRKEKRRKIILKLKTK